MLLVLSTRPPLYHAHDRHKSASVNYVTTSTAHAKRACRSVPLTELMCVFASPSSWSRPRGVGEPHGCAFLASDSVCFLATHAF